jgi:hypothetical protein
MLGRVALLIIFGFSGWAQANPVFERSHHLHRFAKAQLHAHSLASDGDAPLQDVARFYEQRGYGVLAITDHSAVPTLEQVQAWNSSGSPLLLVSGIEVSHAANRPVFFGGRQRPFRSVHVNGFCVKEKVRGRSFRNEVTALRAAVQEVLAQPGAVAMVNHPNYEWSLDADEIAAVSGASLLEIQNQHFHVRNDGGLGHRSTMQIWDDLLGRGIRLWGTATDDMHDLVRTRDDLGYTPRRGDQGWVQVKLEERSAQGFCNALRRGDFYGSTGAEFSRIRVSGQQIEVSLASGTEGEVRFVGRGGRTLRRYQRSRGGVYELRPGDLYVRVEARTSAGQAWTQPYFVSRSRRTARSR